jgi:uncharacterized protein GlcG (DUF336 family)
MLKLAEANQVAEAALAKADELAIHISVSICDAYGRLIAHQRMDDVFAEASHAPIIRARGGLPIIRGDEVEGGVGVCGGHTHEQDEECARVGIQALKEHGLRARV